MDRPSLLNISLGFPFRSMLLQKLRRWRELIWQNQFSALETSEPFGGDPVESSNGMPSSQPQPSGFSF
jgi:hypothetical protein